MDLLKKQLEMGQEFFRTLEITQELLIVFGDLAKDYNRIHTDEDYAKSKGYKGKVSYGNILGLLISALVGESLKEYKVILISQSINYKKPFYLGDTITLKGKVREINEVFQVVKIKLQFSNISGDICASGDCMVKYLNDEYSKAK